MKVKHQSFLTRVRSRVRARVRASLSKQQHTIEQHAVEGCTDGCDNQTTVSEPSYFANASNASLFPHVPVAVAPNPAESALALVCASLTTSTNRSCSQCTSHYGCGFCNDDLTCSIGDNTGPSGVGSCASGWRSVPFDCDDYQEPAVDASGLADNANAGGAAVRGGSCGLLRYALRWPRPRCSSTDCTHILFPWPRAHS